MEKPYKEFLYTDIFDESDFVGEPSSFGFQDYSSAFEGMVFPIYEKPMPPDFIFPATRVEDNLDAQPWVENDRRIDSAAVQWLETIVDGTYDDNLLSTICCDYDMNRIKVACTHATSSYTGVVLQEVRKYHQVNNLPSWLEKKCISENLMVQDSKAGLSELSVKKVPIHGYTDIDLAPLSVDPVPSSTGADKRKAAPVEMKDVLSFSLPPAHSVGIELAHMGNPYKVAVMPHVPGLAEPYLPFETRFTDNYYVVAVQTRHGPKPRYISRSKLIHYKVCGADLDTIITVKRNMFMYRSTTHDYYDYYIDVSNDDQVYRDSVNNIDRFIAQISKKVPSRINMFFQLGHNQFAINYTIPIVVNSRLQTYSCLPYGRYFATNVPLPMNLRLVRGAVFAGRKQILFGSRFLHLVTDELPAFSYCCENSPEFKKISKYKEYIIFTGSCSEDHAAIPLDGTILIATCVYDKYYFCSSKPFADECVPDVYETEFSVAYEQFDFEQNI